MKKKKITYLFLLFVLRLPFIVQGQQNICLYGLRGVPQSNYENPSFFPEETRFVSGIPLLSGLSGNLHNTAFSFDELFKKSTEYDSLYLDLQPVIDKNTGIHKAYTSLEHDLLYFGFRSGKTFLTFGLKQRVTAGAVYTDDLLRLLWEGNATNTDNTLNMDNSQISEMHYFDYHMGLALKAGEAVTLGFGVHLLQGLSNISFEKSNLSLTTQSDPSHVFSVAATSNILIHTSGLEPFTNSVGTQNSLSSYFFDFNNSGFSLDAGIAVQFSERVSVTGSILNLGSITWRNKPRSYSSLADSIRFDGIKVDILHDTAVFTTFTDTLKSLLQIQTDTVAYSTSLHPLIRLGLELYSMDRRGRFSFLFAGRFDPTGFEPAVSIAYDRKVSDHFTYKISYAYLKYAPMNFGGGLVFDFKPFQFYFLTDNFFGFLLPKRQRIFQVSFGINIKIQGHAWSPPAEYEPSVFQERKASIPEIVDFNP